MQKRIIMAGIIMFFFFLSNGQKITISGTLYDSKDKKNIAYVNIQIKGSNVRYDTDEKGYFIIETNAGDTVLFSCIGYSNLMIDAKMMTLNNDSLFLTGKTYDLGNVTVKNLVKKQIGIISAKQTRSMSGDSESDSYELTTLIEIPNGIDSFRLSRIFFKQKNFDKERPMRLHVYSVTDTGVPGEELLKKQVIISENEFNSGTLNIDIREQDIIMQNTHFFVGIQWIRKATLESLKGKKNDNGIGETNTVSNRLTYRRGRALNYQWYAAYESGIYIPASEKNKISTTPIPLKGNPINMLAAAEIEIL